LHTFEVDDEEQNMKLAIALRNRALTVAADPRAALALILVVVLPGGFVLPLCYAAYHAVRRTLRK
jgi:hypothetical protein